MRMSFLPFLLISANILAAPWPHGDWTEIHHLGEALPADIAFTPHDPQRIFICTYAGGLLRTFDGGQTWHTHTLGPDTLSNIVSGCVFASRDPWHGIALTYGGPYVTDDGGVSWSLEDAAMRPTLPLDELETPDAHGVIVTDANWGRFWYYDWQSATWDLRFSEPGFITRMSFGPGADPPLYIASENRFVIHTEDLGLTRGYYSNSQAGNYANCVLADLSAPGRVLASSGGTLWERAARIEYWWPIAEGDLPGSAIRTMVQHPVLPALMFLATSDDGVWVSETGGESWALMEAAGIYHDSIVDLDIDPNNPDYMIAVAHDGQLGDGGGVYRVRVSVDATSIDDAPELGRPRVSPNPFNPNTTISYTLPRAGRVELSVFDLVGRLIARLVDEDKPAGRHEAVWRGEDDRGRRVASGTYYCRLEFGGLSERRLMTLVK